MRRSALISLVVVCSVASSAAAPRPTNGVSPSDLGDPANWIAGEIVVKFDTAASEPATRDDFASRLGLTELSYSAGTGWGRYQYPEELTMIDMIQRVRTQPEIANALPSAHGGQWLAFPQDPPSDPRWGDQWGLQRVNVLQAWRNANPSGGSGSKMVAVIDSGVKGGMNSSGVFTTQHPDLGFIDGRNFILPWQNGQPQRRSFSDSCASSIGGHGTRTAGVAAAFTNNSTGIAGVAFNAQIFSLRVDDECVAGSISWSAIADAIVWATDNDAYAINLSAIVYSPTDSPFQYLKDAVVYAWDRGVPVTVGTGNGYLNGYGDYIPARWSKVISVGGSDHDNPDKAWYVSSEAGSNHGSPGMDVAAPAEYILTTDTTTVGYSYASGTSFAAPLVAGIVFLIKSEHPGWGSGAIQNAIRETADKVGGYNYSWKSTCGGMSNLLGCGILDADSAVDY